MKGLKLAEDLVLPADEAVTQKYGFIGRSGSGKSYAAMRLAELFLECGAQIIALDWVGIWWSLRLAADGKHPGFPHVYIFGGEHKDVDLLPESGALIADLVVDKHLSVVLDVMHFRKAERTRFATAFAEQFFHRKKTARTACHLFIEEAQAYLPQFVRGEEARMVGVFEDIGKVGRNYGIGNSLISQRPQAINKDVLNQLEVLLAFQANGPQERKAIAGWTAENTSAGAAMMQELPKLRVGHALVWSPQWLRIAQPAAISRRVTYDASSTPTQRAKAVAPTKLAPEELAQLGEQMAATIERAKADDPRELKKQIAGLTKRLAEKEAVLAEVDHRTARIDQKFDGRVAAVKETRQQIARQQRALDATMKILLKVKAVDFAVDSDADRQALEQAIAGAVKQVTGSLEKRVNALVAKVEGLKKTAADAERAIAALLDEQVDLAVEVQKREPFSVTARQGAPRQTATRPAVRAADAESGDTAIRGGKFRAMLVALAQVGRPLSDTQVAARAVMALSGTFARNHPGRTRRAGALRAAADRRRSAGALAGRDGRRQETGDARRAH